jgi:hypothetical protein
MDIRRRQYMLTLDRRDYFKMLRQLFYHRLGNKHVESAMNCIQCDLEVGVVRREDCHEVARR